ncbi:MAG TPA: DUF192 domain-containing protein [Actinomycetota bacterium]|nr:DUF192 domain-containing protein [Actinomycetota bacterium]
MRHVVAATLLLGLLVACGDDATQPAAAPSPTARLANVLIDTGDDSVLIRAEVADTPELRSRGLSNRDSLADDGGMVFLFFEETTGGFWMKDTTIPLSIAFFDSSGEIIAMFDMDPCEADPCKTYDPGVPYRGALEVNQGAFEEWGVEVGHHIRVSP